VRGDQWHGCDGERPPPEVAPEAGPEVLIRALAFGLGKHGVEIQDELGVARHQVERILVIEQFYRSVEILVRQPGARFFLR